ncbi:hypothetical protein F8A87_00305 [Betaproteobacteria bacterium SCN2]|jgi:hypothetical protein|nr:hypothetical protein F8A87_00305 [Betaproteobacteria bacterium SCN2]
MAQLPDAVEQVLRLHAAFIHGVVNALRDRSQLPLLHEHLKAAEEAGWGKLVAAIRQILDGKRGEDLKLGLDEEDRILVDAILRGIDNPATLPPLQQPDGAAAAPGLAAMIHAAGSGDAKAFAALANMAEQMMKAGGDMARLGGVMRRLVDGERDSNKLSKGMGPLGKELVVNLLDELAKLRAH